VTVDNKLLETKIFVYCSTCDLCAC